MDVSSSGCPLQNFLASKALSLQIHSEGFFIKRNKNLKSVKAQKENVNHLKVKAINLESILHLCIHILRHPEGIEFSVCATVLHCKLLVWMNNHLLKNPLFGADK